MEKAACFQGSQCCAPQLVSKELIQKKWAEKAGKAHSTAATFGLSIHQLLSSATINIIPLSTGSPWSCCTNMDKSGTVLHWMPSYVLFHNEVYFPLFSQEYISAETEISGSIWANSQQFWNSFLVLFLNTQVRKKWQICQDDLLWMSCQARTPRAVQVAENGLHTAVLIIQAIQEKDHFPKVTPMSPLRKSRVALIKWRCTVFIWFLHQHHVFEILAL